MAKKKKESSTTAKIKELKGVKPEKVTTEELQELQNVAGRFDAFHLEIGRLEATKYRYLISVDGLQNTMRELQVKLENKYGDVDIDVRDGMIKYPENGEVDKKD